MNIPRLKKQPVDTSIVSRMMKPVPFSSVNVRETKLYLYNILKDVSIKTNISVDVMKGKSRKREVVEARQLFFKRAKEITNLSLSKIGSRLNRDHSTVLYGIKTVNNLKSLSERYDVYFNGRKPFATLTETAAVLKKSPDEVELVVKKSECLKTHGNAFISPYRNITPCTNQPYMGYKS
jgi:hypothetical protein